MKNQVRPASSCVANVIYPWSQLTVPDPHFNASNGFPPRKVYVEGVDYLPGLAGESRDFDANGPYIRILGVGGTLTYSLQPGLFGQSLSSSTRPRSRQLPPGGKRPPYRRTLRARRRPRSPTCRADRRADRSQINDRLAPRRGRGRRKAQTSQRAEGREGPGHAAGLKVNSCPRG